MVNLEIEMWELELEVSNYYFMKCCILQIRCFFCLKNKCCWPNKYWCLNIDFQAAIKMQTRIRQCPPPDTGKMNLQRENVRNLEDATKTFAWNVPPKDTSIVSNVQTTHNWPKMLLRTSKIRMKKPTASSWPPCNRWKIQRGICDYLKTNT